MSGVSRLQYPTFIRVIRVMCSGRVDPKFVFYAFQKGIEGVMIVGCRLNECKYITHGNYHALNMVLLSKRIMEYIGLNPERLMIEFMNSSEGQRFAETVTKFTSTILELGPVGKGKGERPDGLKERIGEVLRLLPYIKLQMREKLSARLEDPALWDGHFTLEEVRELFEKVPSYWIDPEECRACMACLRRCPVGAIDGGKKLVHIVKQDLCIKCGTCMEACRFGAVKKLVDQPVPPPIPEDRRQVKKEEAA